ncbi:MAG: rod shape-determining protein MreC [Candidatus Omnitrophota bacterium]
MKDIKKYTGTIVGILFLLCCIFYLPYQVNARLKLQTISFIEIPLKFFSFINNQIKNVFFYPVVLKENNRLREKNAALEEENVRLKEILKENERLNSLLSFKEKSPFKLIPARVIAKDAVSWKKSITIDKGLNDGIYLEMPVITSAGLVGWIKSAGLGSSQVMLITDINSKVAALIQDTRWDGIAEGTSANKCRLKFIETEAEVKTGQVVVTSGLSSIIPKGIMIGTVSGVSEERGQVEKSIGIKPSVDFDRLEEVLCINLSP